MKSLDALHIVREQRNRNRQQDNQRKETIDPTSEWLDHPERWDRQAFVISTTRYLIDKNGGVDIADKHLLAMLTTQIEIYVESTLKLRSEGLVVAFNAGVTVGPSPYIAIADKALYRIVQVMKELELSPKARDGYQSSERRSPELLSLLNGP